MCDFAKLKTSPLGVAVHYNDDVLCTAAGAGATAGGGLALRRGGREHCIVCHTATTVHRHAMLIHRHAAVMLPAEPRMASGCMQYVFGGR